MQELLTRMFAHFLTDKIMQKYLLDTSICVFCLRNKYDIQKKMLEVGIQNCYISEITVAELRYGAEYSSNKEHNMKLCDELVQKLKVIPFGTSINLYSSEKARLRKSGTPVEDFDLVIGCTSVACDMIMVTDNIRHFKNIQGIQIENWIDRTSE